MRNEVTMKSSRSRGFTLIELLVVIAIISILASILFPVFSRARENARKISCLSNMKQLGLSFMQYTMDYDGKFPGAGQFQRWGDPDNAHWVHGTNGEPLYDLGTGAYRTGQVVDVAGGSLYNYVKSTQVYMCPSNLNREKVDSYSMNCALAGARDSAISEPSSVILVDDEASNNDGYFYAVNSPNSTDQLTRIHNGGGNLAYCDGHAKFCPFEKYPINNANGALKTRTTGEPRFYDLGLGAAGYANSGVANFGTCDAP